MTKAAQLNQMLPVPESEGGLEIGPPLFYLKKDSFCQVVTPVTPGLMVWSLRLSGHTGAIPNPHSWPQSGSVLKRGWMASNSGLGWVEWCDRDHGGNQCHPKFEACRRESCQLLLNLKAAGW